jgi:hypothetical protein
VGHPPFEPDGLHVAPLRPLVLPELARQDEDPTTAARAVGEMKESASMTADG